MSWIEKIKNSIEVTTGDGKTYFPQYKIDTKTTEFNVAEFEFPNIEGTLVKRSLVKGTRYKFEFYFQGENHLDESLLFETSAKDKRPWKITHPIFGKLTVQPTSLEYDPTGLGITKITGDFIETISDEYPRVTKDQKNEIALNFENTKTTLVESFSNNVQAEASDISKMTENNESLYSLGAESVKSGEQSNEYFQIYQKSNAAITNLIANGAIAAQYAIDLYVYPSLFINGIKNRLLLFGEQLNTLSVGVENLFSFNEKTIYEMTGASVISAMINATINPADDDFQNADEVLESIDLILAYWNEYLNNIDSLQTETNDTENSYIPDFDSLQILTELVNFGTANLLDIALNANSKRSLILDCDSNAILLAHRFYGLDISDETLTRFINQNNLSIKQLIQIDKGTKIIYYI